MSEKTDIRDSKRESMGISDTSQEAQIRNYNLSAYSNCPIITGASLGIRGDVKTLRTDFFCEGDGQFYRGETRTSTFDKDDRIINEVIISNEDEKTKIDKSWIYTGKELRSFIINTARYSKRYEYIYEQGILFGKKNYKDDEVIAFVQFLYGKDVMLRESYGSNGKIETRTRKRYDSRGNETESVLSFNFFDNHHRIICDYDSENRLIKCDKWNCDKKLTDSVIFIYNDCGDLMRTENSVTGLNFDYKYMYDAKGNWTEKQIRNEGELQTYWKRIIEYK